MNEVPVAFAEAHKHGWVVARGRSGARFLLSVEPGWIFFHIEGEPTSEHLFSIFDAATKAGVLHGAFSMLIDMTTFTGAMNWSAVAEMRDGIDWDKISKLNVAYVVRDMEFALLVKIAGVIFPKANNRTFLDREEALDWLRAQAA